MWETRSPLSIKASIFKELRELGADYAEASYSGGNDEGGIDDIQIYRIVPVAGGTGEERLRLDLPDDVEYEHPLWAAFDELLSLEFGTWAGEFSAHGTVYADVRANKVTRSGETSHYDPDGGEW